MGLLKRLLLASFFFWFVFQIKAADLPYLKVSPNGRFLTTEKGEPFFWLGDTGWLLFQRLNHQEVKTYLDNRKAKGFNVIQIMMFSHAKACNVYGDSALVNENITTPCVTEGNKFSDATQYDYWDNVEWVVDEAARRGIYVALVPIWGNVVKKYEPTPEMVRVYMDFICSRFSQKTNVLWLCGGDIQGDKFPEVWRTMGETIKRYNPKQLVTYHPFGRTQSSTWFHTAAWLDMNMFQSGHKNYEQDTDHIGQDNWKYLKADYERTPIKPVLDGEPGYEGIPQGLHDTLQPLWKADDVRRSGYWSVFAGGCGFTYGNNSVFQFYRPHGDHRSYGATESWTTAIDNPGSGQMQFLKKLILSKPYFERVPDQSLIVGAQGEKYDYITATRGKNYAFIYTFTGRNFTINATKQLKSPVLKASWYNPRTGKKTSIGSFANKGDLSFNPPGEPKDGNDWVLVLEGK